ncbi:hypothetical protein Acr_17g0010860 [Actinidia rufa]|uniref:Uncharacterized protein n=1 Tax=Actinidia rufa TaxID=165716 RepID=A0A7J0G402_9ERIC|nr:hypothetical protein Acr_17g0010860 [Actinidia rufa]
MKLMKQMLRLNPTQFIPIKCLKVPHATVLGYKNHFRSAWFRVERKERAQASSIITSSISAATSPSSISLILSSLLGAWLESPTKTIFTSNLVHEDRSPTTVSIRYIAMLSYFLVVFSSLVQTASNFWSVGVRTRYFAITLLLWIFGPIPMFVSIAVMVVVLHNLDSNSTPLHQVQPPPSRDFFKKMDQEMTTWELKQNPSVTQQGNNST